MGLKDYIEIPLDLIDKADWNYKEDDAALLKKLVNNFKRNGQVESVIVREMDGGRYEMVNGNHRLDAMRILEFPVVVAYNLGKCSEAAARRVAIETNETKFKSNDMRLSMLINQILGEYGEDELVETMPYTADELADLRRLQEFALENFRSDIELVEQPQGDSGGLPRPKETLLALPSTCEEIKLRLRDEQDEAAKEADAVELTVRRAIRLPLTEAEFQRFCQVFDLSEKKKYKKDRLIEFLNSKHADEFMTLGI